MLDAGKVQYFIRYDSFFKTVLVGKIEGKRREEVVGLGAAISIKLRKKLVSLSIMRSRRWLM